MLHKIRAYAELLRLSNVLTAVADVWMGMIVATGTLAPWTVSVPLTLASVCLYLSGMVLNDVFDAVRDADERPTRPIPSGRIRLSEARNLGWGLVASGVSLACAAAWASSQEDVVIVGVLLAAVCVAYNWTKFYFLMALCRVLNVLLGLVMAGKEPTLEPAYGWLLAGHFVFFVGLTMFAKKEAARSDRRPLAAASCVALLGLLIDAAGPLLVATAPSPVVPTSRWVLLWSVVAMLTGRRFAAAVLQPTPKHIQSAVGNAIQSIILIDAALAWGYAGPFWGLAILALLPPTMLMARFIPQT